MSTAALDMDLQPLVAPANPTERRTPALLGRLPRFAATVPRAVQGLLLAAAVLAVVLLPSAPLGQRGWEPLSSVQRPDLVRGYDDLAATLLAAKQYNETVAAAMAVPAKVAYCDGKPGTFGSAAYSCGTTGFPEQRTACEEAGFTVTPGSVVGVQGQSDLALVARLQLLGTAAPDAPPAAALVFRGSLNTTRDLERDGASGLVPLDDDSGPCPLGRVHAGFYRTWKELRPQVLFHLQQLRAAFVTCTGHGAGAALAALAMYDLKSRGFQVAGSYVFSMPPPGNAAFAKCFDKTFGGLTPLFRVTHAADFSCSTPPGFQHVGAEVHYRGEDRGGFSVCHSGDKSCGCARYKQASLSREAMCTSPVAPEGSFCQFGSYPATCFLGTGFHWSRFGPSLGTQALPEPVGFNAAAPAV